MLRSLKIAVLLPAIFFAVVCHAQTSKINKAALPNIYGVKDNDKEMIAAIEKARATFKEFEQAFSNKNAANRYFSIKKMFKTPAGVEHIWISQVTKVNLDYYGVISNVPKFAKGIKPGDKIKLDKKTMSDWMFIDKNKVLHGGYTIRLLRYRMQAKDREEFDEENNWIIK